MRPTLRIGTAILMAVGLAGCATAAHERGANKPGANKPGAQEPANVANVTASNALAEWDDSPPPPGAGEEFAPPPPISTDESIATFEKRVQKSPNDSFALTVLGRLHLRRAKATGNRADTAAAEELFRRAMEADPDYSAPPMFLAVALQEQHRFAESLSVAEKVLSGSPKNTLALAIVGDAQFELGRYEQADQSYQKLAADGRSAPVLARLARFAELNGKPDETLQLLSTAAEQQAQAGIIGPDRAWYEARIGEVNFDIGRLDAAEQHYRAALQTDPKCEEAIAGQATVLAARGDLKQAIEWQTKAVALVPDLHGLATLGDLYAAVGDPAQAEQNYDRAVKAGIVDVAHHRLLARFYCDHDRDLEAALGLAREDLNQRQDIFAYDTLAWALYKTDHPRDAATAMEQALKLGTQSAPLFYHAGMIHYRLGETERARELLQRALALNPRFQ